jgi:hypothetical protein
MGLAQKRNEYSAKLGCEETTSLLPDSSEVKSVVRAELPDGFQPYHVPTSCLVTCC